jgi:hypothetical protein
MTATMLFESRDDRAERGPREGQRARASERGGRLIRSA